MNEIEKLYENAGIEKELAYFECNRGRSSMRCCPISSDERDKECSSCFFRDKMKEVYEYPPFTAEKQLEIENVILQNKKNYNKWIEYNINVYGEWVIRFVRTDKFAPYVALGKTRAEALANLVNKLWQELTLEEKQQIKEILK